MLDQTVFWRGGAGNCSQKGCESEDYKMLKKCSEEEEEEKTFSQEEQGLCPVKYDLLVVHCSRAGLAFHCSFIGKSFSYNFSFLLLPKNDLST